MSDPLLLAIDQGTTGTTCLLVAPDGMVHRRAYRPLAVSYPRPGWVEQDPQALLTSVLEGCTELLADGTVPAALGITNQRETLVVFSRGTLAPVAPAIVWQDRRSSTLCREHRRRGEESEVRQRTGLLFDPYFTATKIEWLLRERPELRPAAERGELCASTVDCWLLARLSGGARIATDASNASRTLLYDLRRGAFDPELCALFDIPAGVLPEVVDTAGRLAMTDPAVMGMRIPISALAGDQQSALFGQACIEPGMAKNTYGTGSFVLVNAGNEVPPPASGLLTTAAWRLGGRDTFALEGAIFVTGAGLQWLRDGLGMIASAGEAGPLFDSVSDSNGCYFVPALAGLGAPHWDPEARGALLGLSAGVSRAHVVRAVVEAMAYRTREVVEAMAAAGTALAELRVDGGASVMDGLCAFQADLLGVPVVRSTSAETTAVGAALLAAVGEGLVDGPAAVAAGYLAGRRFEPADPGVPANRHWPGWQDAVRRVRSVEPETERR
ncbi:MAG: FGGY family carbohydrate kinase [Candidatus Dormibacteria bacterium]